MSVSSQWSKWSHLDRQLQQCILCHASHPRHGSCFWRFSTCLGMSCMSQHGGQKLPHQFGFGHVVLQSMECWKKVSSSLMLCWTEGRPKHGERFERHIEGISSKNCAPRVHERDELLVFPPLANTVFTNPPCSIQWFVQINGLRWVYSRHLSTFHHTIKMMIDGHKQVTEGTWEPLARFWLPITN